MQITWRYASGGVLIRRTYVGSEAMPTFKLPHYRWEKHRAIWICYMPFINDCVCQVVSAGICLVALAVTRLSEMKLTEHLAVSQSDGGGDGSQSEWHLSWCTSGFSSEPPARATRGFHWSYMLQGRPFSVRSKGWGSESPPSHLETCSTVSTWPNFSPDSCFSSPSSFRFSGWLGFAEGCCYVKREQHAVMLSIWFPANYATAELHEEPCGFQQNEV